ncbi:S-locus-specific glycoprotein S6 [Hibiscus syriacus]|uniref:S-locus-specific glycoprotein S6 n=1 Tax=Hibiscus syriacus TaxID=106335 RepID=A0A6A2YGS2_HIBSY|nr:S-locus-specific glycoprotein S6 [Hibiscus syriacus]
MPLGCIYMANMEIQEKVKRLPVVSSMCCCKDDDVAAFKESKTKNVSADVSKPSDILIDGSQGNGPELTIVNFSSVAAAVKNFCEANRLGQGGFGPVYKGELPGGQEIAVKRLSGTSGQGLEEFKNEIILIAKLQHRNLVRLLGCSIEGEEKIGYMSPEYAMEGLFLSKSDVYSFGAWSLWNEDKAMELIDPSIKDSCSTKVVLKCIHIGMLCVQDSAMNRPTMATVVLMLEIEGPTLPMPKQPTYTSMRSLVEICMKLHLHLPKMSQ